MSKIDEHLGLFNVGGSDRRSDHAKGTVGAEIFAGSHRCDIFTDSQSVPSRFTMS